MGKRKKHQQQDSGTVAQTAESLLTSTADLAIGKVASARDTLQSLIGSSSQIYGRAIESALTGANFARKRMKKHPFQALGTALGVGVAIGFALVPRLQRSFVSGDEEGARTTLDDGIALAMAFTLPAAAALFIMPYFLIDATVTRGAFTHADAARTADVLRQFAWGVPAFVLAKVFTPPFFARQDMKRPMNFAMVSVAVNVVLGAGLYFGLGRPGMGGGGGPGVPARPPAWVKANLLSPTPAPPGL